MKDRYVNVCARSSPATMLANYGGVVISAEFLEEWVIMLLTQPGKIALALIGPASKWNSAGTRVPGFAEGWSGENQRSEQQLKCPDLAI